MMFEKVCSILSEFVNVDMGQVTPESELAEDLGMNSLELMEAAMRLEEEFNVEIPDREIYGFRVVGDVVGYLERG